MSDECECDRVRIGEGGLKIGGTGAFWTGAGCLCNFAPYDTVILHLSDKIGGFASWPDTLDIPVIEFFPCFYAGSETYPSIDINAAAAFSYVDGSPPSWQISFGTILFNGVTTTFIGEFPWDSFVDNSSTIYNANYSGPCTNNPMPGPLGTFSTSSGDSVTITITVT